MPTHLVEFEYSIREGADIEIDAPEGATLEEIEEIATRTIKEDYPDVFDIAITKDELL